MIPDVDLGTCCCKAVAAPVVVNASESPFAAKLKDWSVILQQRSCLIWCKRDLPKLDCAVCAARYASIPILCDADTLDL